MIGMLTWSAAGIIIPFLHPRNPLKCKSGLLPDLFGCLGGTGLFPGYFGLTDRFDLTVCFGLTVCLGLTDRLGLPDFFALSVFPRFPVFPASNGILYPYPVREFEAVKP